ncbi:hypothetical protein TSOC_015440, partial [Tetrabaena socialis]
SISPPSTSPPSSSLGYPAQAASLEFAVAQPAYHSRRETGLPHLLHFTNQQADMLVGLNSYSADLTKKRAAEARATQGLGCLVNGAAR